MLIITLEGGLIQDILTDNPQLLKEECIVVDYDAEGCDDAVVNMNGDACCPCRHDIREVDRAYCDDIVKITNEREVMQ